MSPDYKLYKFADFTLDPVRRTLFRNNLEIKINERDFDVLIFLIENSPQVCSFDEIIKIVWNGTSVTNNSVEKIITKIRDALGDEVSNPRFIKTRRGKGYSFICPVHQVQEKIPSSLYDGVGNSAQTERFEPPTGVKNRRLLNSRLVVFFIIILCLLLVSGFFWWKGKEVLENFNSKSIFRDDFSGNKINTTRWTIKGKTVNVKDGIAKLIVEETDRWGRLESAYFSFDRTKPVTVTSRLKVAYSQNLKDKFYFHGYFCLSPKTSLTEEEKIKHSLLFGIFYENFDYESKYPDGNTDEQRVEGFFLARDGGTPHRRIDYEAGKISPRIEPVWNKWFEQKIVYEPFSGKVSYFIDGELKGEFNVGVFQTDLQENQLRLEINPEGWWLHHSIEIDYVEVTQ